MFLVSGEDPEAVAQVIRLAMDFRFKFRRDVVIEMYGYRRLGHNEGDEPGFTQPLLYRAIEQRQPVREGYLEHLLELGGLIREEADRIAAERYDHLEQELAVVRSDEFVPRSQAYGGIWRPYRGGADAETAEVETGVERSRLSRLLELQTQVPEDFHLPFKLRRLMVARREMGEEGRRPRRARRSRRDRDR